MDFSTDTIYEQIRVRNRSRTVQAHITFWILLKIQLLISAITCSYSIEVMPEYRNSPSIRVISPLQGSYNSGGRCEISWVMENFSPQASTVVEFNESITDHAIIFVNGIKAISSQEVVGKVFLQQLSAGAYRIDAMLGRYDELDGITSVLSNHVVEFFVDLQPPVSRTISRFDPLQIKFKFSARSCRKIKFPGIRCL
jgi:hypothetical protein